MNSCLFFKFNNICDLSRKVNLVAKVTRSITYSKPFLFNVTPILCAEPLKKKTRVDVNLLKTRDDRKKRRIEKEMKRLSKNVLRPKPLDEMIVPIELTDNLKNYTRQLVKQSSEEIEDDIDLNLAWSLHKKIQFKNDIKMMKKVFIAKEIALEVLRDESEELYQEAIQLDVNLLPFRAKGPCITPPIKNFNPVDGEINDVTRNWEKL